MFESEPGRFDHLLGQLQEHKKWSEAPGPSDHNEGGQVI